LRLRFVGAALAAKLAVAKPPCWPAI